MLQKNYFCFGRIFFWIFVVIFLGNVLFGCAERKHSNPLDPLNPATKGRPIGLHVVSDHHKVFLNWPDIGLNSVKAVSIYRSIDSTANRKIATVPILKRSFVDSNTIYNTAYQYTYSIVADGYESPPSEPQTITPGPSFFWVSFGSIGEIFELTFDIQHTYKRISTNGFPAEIALAAKGKGLWIADRYLGQIYRISNSGKQLYELQGFGRITSIAFDTSASVLWVADSRNKRVVNVDTLGYGKFAVTGFEYPSRLAVNQKNGACWIVDSKQNVVVRSNRLGTKIKSIENLAAPKWVSFPGADGSVWVADSSRIVSVSDGGKLLKEIPGFKYAYRVSVDYKRGALFVLDQSYGWIGTELKKLDYSGLQEFSLRGFGFPKSMVVDSFDGSCIVADNYNYCVVKVSSEGKIVSKKQCQSSPWWIAIEE